eukprot:CAMPEP_0197274394 /NCGR_PEP_ID=MMETSP1432-20130617/12610_1 /TAXON_ID=44447 /ORGANISM="Pseudo-nitzschia delicatissima, Strain UNC1205" /LENGTH=127 /DNA_ID=CAMNT_0042740179 /DNA_START=1037 /DNA_END=1417 /DNA_ORIENTATION=+
MIDDKLEKMLKYVFNESEDPRNKELSRSEYQSEFKDVIKRCNRSVDSLCLRAMESLQEIAEDDPNSYEAKLMNFDEEIIHPDLVRGDLNHGRFMEAPKWALQPDLAGAIRGLHQVGVIDSIEQFCVL